MSTNLGFRAATEKDKQFLLQLRIATMNRHISNAGLEPNHENHIERINYRFESAQIIEYAGQSIGLLKVVKEGSVWDLVQIQLDSNFQGKGLGRKIIQSVIVEAKENGARVKLSVFKKNPALGLYLSLGFITYMETENTYEMLFS
ncbi:GNAT family N-acetyltransferase [Cellvibrio mixtus]|uniref:GNAT family N-acetyltransferase n=1 Tax=Cellvibrio mixtus TaxID=39650 RepID=UPI000587FB4D|nr:GNAT family N-acetyltransferase [Cellvibrio mixtus]